MDEVERSNWIHEHATEYAKVLVGEECTRARQLYNDMLRHRMREVPFISAREARDIWEVARSAAHTEMYLYGITYARRVLDQK